MKTLSPEQSYALIQNDAAILIDVREIAEHQQAHIKGAQLAPLSDLPLSIQKINLPENKKIIVYCLKGGRSAEAIAFLEENIFKGRDVYNMDGGILGWAEAGLPVEK